jgi:hypothetical protein
MVQHPAPRDDQQAERGHPFKIDIRMGLPRKRQVTTAALRQIKSARQSILDWVLYSLLQLRGSNVSFIARLVFERGGYG